MNEIRCEVSSRPIDPAEFVGFAGEPSHGARILFFGAVRNFNAGRSVEAVSYDAFEPLAETVLREICHEVRSQWGADLGLAVIHRTGRLAVGELSVGIAVSSRHRDEAYQASRYVIEQIKVRVPVWKQEHYRDGDSEWVRGHALCQHASSHEGEARV